MAYDANLSLIANGTYNSSGVGTSINTAPGSPLPAGTWAGTPVRGMCARFDLQSFSGSGTVLFYIATSPDNSSWNTIAQLEGGPVNTPGQYFVHFSCVDQYIQGGYTINGLGTSWTGQGDLGLDSQDT